MELKTYLNEGNSLFVDEKYDLALERYTQAILLDPTNVDYLLKRISCYLKLENYTDALADANEAVKHAPNNAQVYLKKGIALFQLEEYESAKNAFEKGQSIESLDTFKTWIRKCNAELQTESENSQTNIVMEESQNQSLPPSQEKDDQTPVSLPSEPKKEEKPKTNIRHDWYQSHTHVIVTILVKNIKKEDAIVDITDKTLDVLIKLPENNEYQLNLQLCDKIVSAESVVNHFATKIEIKLKKASALHWTTLQQSNSTFPTRPIPDTSSSISAETITAYPTYPSSNKKKLIGMNMKRL